MQVASHAAVLLFDGDCGFCQAVVRYVLRHEKRHSLLFAARQSPYGIAALARHAGLEGVDSVVWIEGAHDGRPERAHLRSDAVMRVAAYLGGWWRAIAIARLVPRRWRDAAYDGVARHRRRWSSAAGSCWSPVPSVRERFIEH